MPTAYVRFIFHTDIDLRLSIIRWFPDCCNHYSKELSLEVLDYVHLPVCTTYMVKI